MAEKTKVIEIPASIYDRLDHDIKASGFDSVSDYVVHLLRKNLGIVETQNATEYAKEEEEKIKQRLKALGYL